MHRRVQMQPSERTRVGIGEQCTTDLVGQFWTQLSFTLSPCNGGKHLGDRKAPRSSDPVGRAKTHRVSRSRVPARRASPTRWHRCTPRPRCPGKPARLLQLRSALPSRMADESGLVSCGIPRRNAARPRNGLASAGRRGTSLATALPRSVIVISCPFEPQQSTQTGSAGLHVFLLLSSCECATCSTCVQLPDWQNTCRSVTDGIESLYAALVVLVKRPFKGRERVDQPQPDCVSEGSALAKYVPSADTRFCTS